LVWFVQRNTSLGFGLQGGQGNSSVRINMQAAIGVLPKRSPRLETAPQFPANQVHDELFIALKHQS
jgi:hypothetical protein